MKQNDVPQRKANGSKESMNTLQQLVSTWLTAEVRQTGDAEDHAQAVFQAAPRPQLGRDLVAAVMATITTASVWARRPVRYLVASMLVSMGVGVVATASSASSVVSLASMPVWRDLGERLVATGYQLAAEIVGVSVTVAEAIASSSSDWLIGSIAPWLGMVLFLAGAAAMTVISSWREKQGWNHA